MIPPSTFRTFFVVIIFVMMNDFSVFSQTTTPANLEANFKKAEAAFKVGDYMPAKVLYQQMLAADSNNYQVNIRLAEIYKAHGENSDAITCYKKAIAINESMDMNYWELALLYKRGGNYKQALKYFQRFQEIHPSKDDKYGLRVENEIKGCELAERQAKERFNYFVKPLNINSTYTDAFPTILDLHHGAKYLLFATNRFQSVNKAPFGLYAVEMLNDSSFNPLASQVENPVKSKKLNAFSASLTADGLTMYFSGSLRKKKYSYLSNIYETHYDIAHSKWSKPMKVKGLDGKKLAASSPTTKPKIMPASDIHPAISGDGMTLVFASDRDGGKGGWDIWMVKKMGENWSAPISVGDAVNTPFDELAPTINADGTKLYFSSEGQVSMGGQDIFVAQGTSAGFGEVQNVGLPINSSGDDFGSMWKNNDSLVYFTSNRSGGAGGEDIFIGTPAVYPEISTFILHGALCSQVSKQKLPFGKVTLYEFGKNGEWLEREQKESSTYDFKVETDKRYKLVGAAEGFAPTEAFIDSKETRSKAFLAENAQLDKNIFLKTDSSGIYSDYYTATAEDVLMKYKINNIYYDYDKYYIRPDAATELDKLLDLLNKHPEATISITSHTDTKASAEYNQKLSELRAGAAVKYLVERGIEPERITFLGMGKTKPIYSPEKNDYEMQVNRRTEFRITSVNFVSKNNGKELQSIKQPKNPKEAQKEKDAQTLKDLNKIKDLKAGIKK